MGRKRHELLPLLRSFPVDNYLIFYRPIKGGIEILRIVSGYRDLNALFAGASQFGKNIRRLEIAATQTKSACAD